MSFTLILLAISSGLPSLDLGLIPFGHSNESDADARIKNIKPRVVLKRESVVLTSVSLVPGARNNQLKKSYEKNLQEISSAGVKNGDPLSVTYGEEEFEQYIEQLSAEYGKGENEEWTISLLITAPYSEKRCKGASEYARKRNNPNSTAMQE